MKKDKEWAQKEVDGYLSYEGVNEARNALVFAKGVIGQLDEPTKVEPLVVPKHLGEWLAERHLGNQGSLFSIIGDLEDMWVGSRFEDFITDNKKQLIEVILGTRGYEVEKEKEKLYIVQLPTNLEDDLIILDADGDIWKDSWPSRYKMTEKRIKEIDERYWPFAVEVAE